MSMLYVRESCEMTGWVAASPWKVTSTTVRSSAGGLAADREELGGQLGAGGGEQLADRAGLDDPALLHQRGRVADRLDDVHLVRDEQDGQAELPVEVAQQLEDGAGGLRVEGAGGLVGEQHLGVAGQGAGDADALLLAAGELARGRPWPCRRGRRGRAVRAPCGSARAPEMPRISSGSSTLSWTVREDSRLKCWKTMPIRLRASAQLPAGAAAAAGQGGEVLRRRRSRCRRWGAPGG